MGILTYNYTFGNLIQTPLLSLSPAQPEISSNAINRWTQAPLALVVPNSGPERILQWATLEEVWARSEVPTKDKTEATSTNAWETILNARTGDDASCDVEAAEDQHGNPPPSLEGAKVTMATTFQELIDDVVKQTVENAKVYMPEFFEEVEQLFPAAELSVQDVICTVVYNAVEQIILD